MRIAICGAGPAGLYMALLARKQLGAEVTVYEQNPLGATYGFGIVLADRGLNRLKQADPESYDLIMKACFISQHRVITHRKETIFIKGDGYGAAIPRLRLLEILRGCAERAGANVQYEHRMEALNPPAADLIVGADGVNSALRNGYAREFDVSSYTLTNKLAWYGTTAHFPCPILSFKKSDRGYFWAVGYAYTEQMSTFVAECDVDTWHRSGLSDMTEEEAARFSEAMFADELCGHSLISNRSFWRSLPVTRVTNWSVGNMVLIGDALHSAHPSIGSGTRIAMDDAIALVSALERHPDDIGAALSTFRDDREPIKRKLIEAAERSFTWFEEIAPRLDRLDPPSLVFDYLTRTGRVDEERLYAEFPDFMSRYRDEWRAFSAAYRTQPDI